MGELIRKNLCWIVLLLDIIFSQRYAIPTSKAKCFFITMGESHI